MDELEITRLLLLIRDNGHDVVYMERTREELDQLGVLGYGEKAFDKVLVRPWDGDTKQTMVVCTVILAGEMLSMEGNVTAPCAWKCGRTVQHRPWHPPALQKVCLYCAAERKMKDQ